MDEPKFKKGDWVVRVDGNPSDTDRAKIGDMRQIDEESSCLPYVTHISFGCRDVIDQDDYRLATPEELERVK